MAEKEKRKPRHERMYDEKPHLERDEGGNMAVKKNDHRGEHESKGEKASDKVQADEDGMKMHEGMPPHIRHAHERMDMHKRHEMEHAVHDHAKGGHKEEMHSRHEKEMKDMHGRHEKEMMAGEHKDEDIKEGKEKPEHKE